MKSPSPRMTYHHADSFKPSQRSASHTINHILSTVYGTLYTTFPCTAFYGTFSGLTHSLRAACHPTLPSLNHHHRPYTKLKQGDNLKTKNFRNMSSVE